MLEMNKFIVKDLNLLFVLTQINICAISVAHMTCCFIEFLKLTNKGLVCIRIELIHSSVLLLSNFQHNIRVHDSK